MTFVECVIKDGNRTVSWIFPSTCDISGVLDKWEEEYFPCNRKRVFIENRLLKPGCLECQLNFFQPFGKKLHIRLESVKPLEKKEEVKEQNG